MFKKIPYRITGITGIELGEHARIHLNLIFPSVREYSSLIRSLLVIYIVIACLLCTYLMQQIVIWRRPHEFV
jgi:hypothetical protein